MLWKFPGILGSNLLAMGHLSIKQREHQTAYIIYTGKETKSIHQEDINKTIPLNYPCAKYCYFSLIFSVYYDARSPVKIKGACDDLKNKLLKQAANNESS